MAKAQSFADKIKKKSSAESARVFRLVYPYRSKENGSWRFVDKFVKVPVNEDESKILMDEIKNGKALLEK